MEEALITPTTSKTRIHLIAFNFFIFFSFVGVSGLLKFLFLESSSDQGGTVLSVSLNVLSYVLAIVYISKFGKGITRKSVSTACVVLILYTISSIFWEKDNMSSFYYINIFHFIGCFCLALAQSIAFIRTYENHRAKLIIALKVGLIMAAIYHIAFPSYSASLLEGRNSSIFATPNNLGQFASLAALYLLIFDEKKISKLFFISIGVYLLLISESYTSFVGLIVCSLLFLFKTNVKKIKFIYYIPFILFFIVTVFFQGSISSKGTVGNRDLSLTGRTTIWELLLTDIKKNYFLGYGFSGYWPGETGLGEILRGNFGTPIAQGHNGYFDLFIDLGLVGYCIFFIGLWKILNRLKVKSFLYRDTLLYILIFILINNITESSFMKSKHILNIQFFFILMFFNYINNREKALSKARSNESVSPEIINVYS
jgi:O-antigen ligase